MSLSLQEHHPLPSLKKHRFAAAANAKTIPDNARILVVDDDKLYQHFLSLTLRKAGAKHLFIAETGVEALTLARLHRPHLIILDINMPEMDGFECCAQLRKDPLFLHTPILVQTATQDEDNRAHMFNLGASDFVRKPINPSELIARSCVHIEHTMLLEHTQASVRFLQKDLLIAKEMQLSLLPSAHKVADLSTQHQIAVSNCFKNSHDLGGDIWDIHTIDAHRCMLYHCDFSAHGIASAINIFRFHTIMLELVKTIQSPKEMLEHLNAIYFETLPVDQFTKLFVAVIDTQHNTLTYSAAGSTRPVYTRFNTSKSLLLNTRSFPLGIVADASYTEHSVDFSQGDSLLLYSDALMSHSWQRQDFEDDNSICQFVNYHFENARSKNLPASSAHTSLFQSFQHTIEHHEQPLHDDVNIIVLTRNSDI